MHYDDDSRIIKSETHTEVTRTSNTGTLTAAAVILAAAAALGVIWMVTMDRQPTQAPAPTVIMPIPSEPAPAPLPPVIVQPALPDPVREAERRALEEATRNAEKATQEAREAARSVPPLVTVPPTELEVKPVPQPEVPHD